MPRDSATDAAETAAIARLVDSELERFVSVRSDELASLNHSLSMLTAVLDPLLAGGKRLRPAFAYWGFRAAGGDDSAELIRAASALELVQIAALIHDDVIDDSASRRGLASAHIAFRGLPAAAASPVDRTHFGVGAAILLGDLCLSWADQLFYESGLQPAQLAAAKPYYDLMRTEVTAGQFLDLLVQAQRSASLSDALAVTSLKTAKYTIERPLHIGAALAGGSQDLLQGLSDYGLPLGIAFQLRDDLLGVFGDPAITGKPAGDDLREGKRTALIAITLSRLGTADSQKFDQLLGNRAATDAELEWMKQQITASGADVEVETLIRDNFNAATDALQRLALPEVAAAALRALATAAASRVK